MLPMIFLQGFYEPSPPMKQYLERHPVRGRTLVPGCGHGHEVALAVEHGLDAIVYPLQRRLVVPLSEPNQADRNGILTSVTGFPAITVPAGFSPPTATAPRGVPVGMDILGRPWSEGRLIELAFSFEQALHARKPPASAPALAAH